MSKRAERSGQRDAVGSVMGVDGEEQVAAQEGRASRPRMPEWVAGVEKTSSPCGEQRQGLVAGLYLILRPAKGGDFFVLDDQV
ncbi:hypothetical protein PM082_014427 [Marasmius tenuissimus]|nr:hypothetical protein PM082_014427 [Marasmius tenuissimus]